MQTGKLLETLAGHKGPVSSLAFHPMEPVLLSGSWDRTVKLWSVFEGKGSRETIELQGDVVAVAFRPDGQQFATSSLKGAIEMWRYPSGQHVGAIEGRGDLAGGRRAGDKVTAKQLEAGRYYSSICYSADGACILAGGQSKYIAIYEANQRVLLRRFPLSSNRSLDGLSAKPNSKLDTPVRGGVEGSGEGVVISPTLFPFLTQHGPLAMLDLDPDSDDEMGARKKPLPGVVRGDFSARSVAPEIRTRAVHFSPTGRAWAAATTEGLVIFSLDDK
jgi:periodic tryptophan protein 2